MLIGGIGINCYRMSFFLFEKSHRAPLGCHLSSSSMGNDLAGCCLAYMESWEQQPSRYHNIIEYVEEMHDSRINELIERLGPAPFITTLDLTKGY